MSEGELALAKQKAADFLNTSAGKVLMRRAELLQREQLALARERAGIDKTLATGIVLDQAAAKRLRDQQVEYEDRERANRAEQTDVFGQIHQGAFPQPAAQPAPPPPAPASAQPPAQTATAPNGLPYAAAGSRLPNGLQAATALHVQIVASRISANWREADPRQVEQALNEMGLSALYESR